LLSGGQHDAINDITERVFLLAGYYRRHGNDTWRIFAPLFFEHDTPARTTFVAPFVWARRSPTHEAAVVFPFIWHVSDRDAGTAHTLVLPLFDWESERHGAEQSLVSIVGAYNRNDDLGLSQYIVWAPPIFHRTDNKRTVDVVPPLFTHWSTADNYSSGVIFGPIAWSADPHGSTTTVFPIYWRFHDSARDATTQFLFPIAGMHQHRGAGGGFLGPLYGWGSKNGDGGFGAGIAPILMFGKSGARRHVLLLPLFAHVADGKAGTSTTAVGPLYVHTTRDGGDGGLFPLVFAGKHGHDSYAFVTPIYWHRGDATGALDVVGPLYLKHGDSGFAFGLAPLLFFGKLDGRAHQVVFPIFWHWSDPRAHQERLVVGPYYHRRDGNETADVLFPLVYLRRSPESGFGLWPIGAWVRENGVNTTVVFPFVHRSNANTRSRTDMFFPLLTLHEAPNYAVKVFFPFVWRVRDGAETNTAVIPFYVGGRGPGFDWDGVFPLFLQTRTSVARTTVLGPLWYRARKDGGRGVGIFPLFAYGKKVADGKSFTWFGMPGVYADENQFAGRGHFWLGPFFYAHDEVGYSSGLVPLAFAWRKHTASKVLTPIFYRQADSARDYALNVFTLLYWGHEGKVGRQGGLFPLFMEKTHADGTWWTTLLPLFYAAKHTDGTSVYTLLGGYASNADGKRLYAGPVYWRNDRKQNSFAIFPIFYWGHNLERGSRTALLLPLFLDTRNGEGREVQAYTPLCWRYHSIESTVTIGIPLMFDVNRFHESRTTAVLPLFMRNRTEIDKSTAYTLPFLLTWWKTPDGDWRNGDYVTFPLVWHFGGKERSTTIVAPFVWDFRRGESRTTVFAPIGAHWRRADFEHFLIFNAYYKRGIGQRQGAYYVNVFPLFTFGRPRKHDLEWYFLEGLFGYNRQGRNRTVRFLWVLDFQLQPLRTSDLSLISGTAPEARELF
jgi:hypothetical protein